MANTVRQQILNQLKSQLQTITTGNGYNNTVRVVEIENRNPEAVDRRPAIFLYDSGAEANEDVNVGNVQVEMQLVVLFFVAGTSSPGVAAQTFLGDIVKALGFSGKGLFLLSGVPVLVRYTGDDLFTAAPNDRDEGGQALFTIQFEHPIGNPFNMPGV